MAHRSHVASIPLPDTNQSVWALSVIQLAGWMSLPAVATSILLLQTNSFLGAVLTIIVGNAILWFIRLGLLAMSRERQSTLDIARAYLGDFGSYFIAALLLVATLAWFVAQTSIASGALSHLISIRESAEVDQRAQISVAVGLISAFLCMEGIVLLRRLTTILFPLILVAFFGSLWLLPEASGDAVSQPLSLSGLTLVLATNLGIASDLPTFFRHSGSWVASLKALTIIQLVTIVLSCVSLYFGVLFLDGFETNDHFLLAPSSEPLRLALIAFIFFSVICANVANVYSASVGWEVLAPAALVGRKEYLILGLGLTLIFILVEDLFSTELFVGLADFSLVNLCFVLVVGYLVRRYMEKPPSTFLQGSYFMAWLLATVWNIVQMGYGIEGSPVLWSLVVILVVMGMGIVGNRLKGESF
jgi:purine-cytosine permease-like protein